MCIHITSAELQRAPEADYNYIIIISYRHSIHIMIIIILIIVIIIIIILMIIITMILTIIITINIVRKTESIHRDRHPECTQFWYTRSLNIRNCYGTLAVSNYIRIIRKLLSQFCYTRSLENHFQEVVYRIALPNCLRRAAGMDRNSGQCSW